jgi:hypothetical protein
MAERRVVSARVIYSWVLLNVQHSYNKSSALGPLLNPLNAINQNDTELIKYTVANERRE